MQIHDRRPDQKKAKLSSQTTHIPNEEIKTISMENANDEEEDGGNKTHPVDARLLGSCFYKRNFVGSKKKSRNLSW